MRERNTLLKNVYLWVHSSAFIIVSFGSFCLCVSLLFYIGSTQTDNGFEPQKSTISTFIADTIFRFSPPLIHAFSPRIVPPCFSHMYVKLFFAMFSRGFFHAIPNLWDRIFFGARFDFRHFQYRPRIRTHRVFKYGFIYTHGSLSCFVCRVRCWWWWWCWRYCMILMICNLSAYFLNRFKCRAILIHWVDSYKIYNDVHRFASICIRCICVRVSANAPNTHPTSDKRKQINLWLCHIVWL